MGVSVMCNACNMMCCGADLFGGCGCECDEPECWAVCEHCSQYEEMCGCHDEWEPELEVPAG